MLFNGVLWDHTGGNLLRPAGGDRPLSPWKAWTNAPDLCGGHRRYQRRGTAVSGRDDSHDWRRAGDCGCGPDGCGPTPAKENSFVENALAETLSGEQVFRVTLTSFLDAYTFDTRQAMKCCLAHVLPSGHVVPFCTYNTLYRDGHVPLPPLADRPVVTQTRVPLVVSGS